MRSGTELNQFLKLFLPTLSFTKSVSATLEMAVHMAAADDVFRGDKFCVVFSHRVTRVGSRIELC